MGITKDILKWDIYLYHFISQNLYQSSVVAFFVLITNLGDITIFLLSVYWLFSWLSPGKATARKQMTYILFPVYIAIVMGIILKLIIQREPPIHHLMPGVEISVPFLPSWYAFPSGHAIRAFALATSLAITYPKYKWLLLAIAMLIGFSRVYIGAHFPLDVVAGAFFGILISLLFRGVAQRRASNGPANVS